MLKKQGEVSKKESNLQKGTRLEFKIPLTHLTSDQTNSHRLYQPYGPIRNWDLVIEITNKQEISLWLSIVDFPKGHGKITINGTFGILNTKGNLCRKKVLSKDYTVMAASWGFSQYQTRAQIDSFRFASKQNELTELTFAFEIKNIDFHQNEKWMLSEIYEHLKLGQRKTAAGLHDTVQNMQKEIVELRQTIDQLKMENKSIKPLQSENQALKRKAADALETSSNVSKKMKVDEAAAIAAILAARKKEAAAVAAAAAAAAAAPSEMARADPLKTLKVISVSEIRDEQLSECQMTLNKLQKELQDRTHLHLQCSICLDRPKTHVVQCGHRFCGQCLDRLQQKVCPGCAVPFSHSPIKIY